MKDTLVAVGAAIILAAMLFVAMVQVEKERTKQIEITTKSGCKK